MLSRQREKDLYKQGYRITGSNFAIKVCMWTKRAIKNEDFCYKQKFYGINSHRCVQMTPSLPFCNHRCVWCWRDIEFTKPNWVGPVDDPKEIVDGCIKEQVRYLQGFRGNTKTNREKFIESQMPMHFAISLSGEPTFYPKLPELIKELKKRNMKLAIISGSLNVVLEKFIPDYNDFFDDVFLSRIYFDESGSISKVEATEFDMDAKALALRRIAKREGISLKECVFVGDYLNDIKVMEEAGLGIAFNCQEEKLKEVADVVIEKKDLREVLRHILS